MHSTWYPWLNLTYKNIINNYQKKKLHHSILIESYNLNNTYKIIWAVIRWILCHNKKKLTNCGKCKSCTLIINKTHPDFYILHPNKTNTIIEIEKIRNTLEIIKNTAQQNNKKILWIPNYKALTIFGINTLLKILEEPPKNTFFFIGNTFCNKVQPTFQSRCVLYKICTPNEKIGLYWIQKNTTISKKKSLIALHIHNNDPESAKTLLKKKNWIKRKELYYNIHYAINKKNFLMLLPILNTTDIFSKIYWIILLILDSLKFNNELTPFITNTDQMKLIYEIKKKYTYINLNNILNSWIKCRYQLINFSNVNYELLILQQLLVWQLSKQNL